MIIPDYVREQELQGKGYKAVAGVDEAGRGPLAGPVVAGAVILPQDPELVAELIRRGLRDSKKVSEKRREQLYDFITEHASSWAVALVSEKMIDEINIFQATLRAMREAVEKLAPSPDHLLIDGNATLHGIYIDQTALPKADERIISVSAASILAKVTRDRLLDQLDLEYPCYGFARHKGYGTKQHLDALREIGPCPIHRRSFEPIRSMLSGGN
jgi:ribonuclease HII